MNTDLIIKKNKKVIDCLINSGRTDINVIAIILCETYFRKKQDRIVEYFSMPFLFFLNYSRFQRLSIGIGQIQLRHWIRLKKISVPLSIESYLIYFSVKNNYDVLDNLISSNLKKGFSETELISFHTGESRKFHITLFIELKNKINGLYKI